MNQDCPPYFLIGAPRSGTKLLRDTIGTHPTVQFTRYPLESIWAAGNRSRYERYDPTKLTDSTRRSIREKILNRRKPGKIFLEKNVQHSIRIPYLHKIFPESPIIHIIRHPLDAVPSIRGRWKFPFDLKYHLLNTLPELSFRDLLYFSLQKSWKILRKGLSGRDRLNSWGPRFDGIDRAAETKDLLELCAIQWKTCVNGALEAKEHFGPENYVQCHYEDLLNRPDKTLKRLANFMNLQDDSALRAYAKDQYRPGNIGRGRQQLSDHQADKIRSIVDDTMALVGYEPGQPPDDAATSYD